MADEINASVPTGPNGEKLTLNLKERSLGLSTKDLLPVLLLLLLGVMAYFRTQTIDANLKTIASQLQALYGHQDTIRDQLQEQNKGVQAQTDELRTELREQNRFVAEKFSQVHDWLDILNHNFRRPAEEALPIDLPPAQLPRSQEDRR